MNKLLIKTLLCILLIISFIAVACIFLTEKPSHSIINKAIGNFQLNELLGQHQLSNGDFPQQPFLINVWASWCFTCSQEHDFLLQLNKKGIKIVGVNYKDDGKKATEYLVKEGNPYLFNIQDLEGTFAESLSITGTPTTYVVDKQGVIRQQTVGTITTTSWNTRIKPCLTALKKTTEEQPQSCQ